MAVLLRCFRPPPRPSPSPSPSPSPPQEISSGNRTCEYVMILPTGKKKTLMFPSSRSNELKFSKGRLLDMVKFDEALANWKPLSSHMSEHQRTGVFSFTKAFVLANTLMIIRPLDALAEVCEADNSLFNMPLLLGVALVGATVGGLLARQRKGELKRLNDQLRQINAALRRQAKIEGYAPNLSYAPVGRVTEEEVIVDPRKQQLLTNLRTGKNYLRNQDPEKAFTEFKVAFELAQDLGDHVEEKKAARGLGASLQRQGKYKDAIKYHSRVLEISMKTGEDSGTTEAYGAIADCYTELGDLERAGKFYDKYIARLQTD